MRIRLKPRKLLQLQRLSMVIKIRYPPRSYGFILTFYMFFPEMNNEFLDKAGTRILFAEPLDSLEDDDDDDSDMNAEPQPEQHKSTSDKAPEEPSLLCTTCGKLFRYLSTLKFHQLSHDGPQYSCDICSKKFLTPRLIKEHMKIHGTRKHACDRCDSTFLSLYHLKRHIRTHTGNAELVIRFRYCNFMSNVFAFFLR